MLTCCPHIFTSLSLFRPSLSSGLDEAILGSSNPEDPEADSGRIARLLKHGAHSLAAAEQNQHGEAFQSENIDEVGAEPAGTSKTELSLEGKNSKTAHSH